MIAITDAKARQRLVASVLADEWPDLTRDDAAGSLVGAVASDLARGDVDNHFHEAVPAAQFGLMLLERVAGRIPDRSAEPAVVSEVLRHRFGTLDEEPTPAVVAAVRRRVDVEAEDVALASATAEYARFGLRLLSIARGERPLPQPKVSLLRRLRGG